MDAQSRVIGRLEGMLKAVQSDVSDIKKDVKSLNSFKWKIAGGSAVVAAIISALIEFFKR
jgi:hypothetical protein